MDGAVPSKVLSLPFKDSDGRTRHLSDFADKVLVISDSMTLCQESCPLDTASMVSAARTTEQSAARDDVEFLTVTVDPGRDTPHRLAVYRRLFHPAPANWLTLTGTPAHVHALWKAFGVYVKRVPDDKPAPRDWLTGRPLTYDVEHSDEVFFLDGHQHERFVLDGVPHVAGKSAIPRTLYQFMSTEGHRNVTHPHGSSWTPAQALRVIGWLDRRQVASS
jgi:cytochrome oxidase Cu insertion factor (SCO1/SenC/PrrC family)